MEPNGKPFCCEKCHSPFIVNPARSHRLESGRKYRPRKITDMVTKKVLVLCNACGLSMARSKKEKHKKVSLYGNVNTHFN
jgi:RNase P subunit RPR2